MNIARHISIACIAAVLAACAAAPSRPLAQSTTTPTPASTAPAVADISGKWIITVQTPQGAVDATMTVAQTGSAIKGTVDSSMGTVDYVGNVNGKDVKFTYSVEKFGAPAGSNFEYIGTIDGAAMKGTATFAGFGTGDWSARRP